MALCHSVERGHHVSAERAYCTVAHHTTPSRYFGSTEPPQPSPRDPRCGRLAPSRATVSPPGSDDACRVLRLAQCLLRARLRIPSQDRLHLRGTAGPGGRDNLFTRLQQLASHNTHAAGTAPPSQTARSAFTIRERHAPAGLPRAPAAAAPVPPARPRAPSPPSRAPSRPPRPPGPHRAPPQCGAGAPVNANPMTLEQWSIKMGARHAAPTQRCLAHRDGLPLPDQALCLIRLPPRLSRQRRPLLQHAGLGFRDVSGPVQWTAVSSCATGKPH